MNIENPPVPITPLGLRPRSEVGYFGNGILMQFTVGPAGIRSESNVKFDITRQIQQKYWKRDLPGGWVIDDTRKSFWTWPFFTEYANDDGPGPRGEPEVDESPAPTEANHMYSFDAPGPVPGGGDEVLYRIKATEWVRVRFDGKSPEDPGILGSRVSNVYDWHCTHYLIFDGQEWKRTTGDQQETDENEIDNDHIDVDAELP